MAFKVISTILPMRKIQAFLRIGKFLKMLNIWNSRGKFTKYGTKIPKISIPIYRKLLKLPWGFLKSKNVFLEKFQAAKTPEFGAWAKLLVWLWMPINQKVFKIQTSNFGDLWINTLVFSDFNFVLIVSKLQPVFNLWWCNFLGVPLYVQKHRRAYSRTCILRVQ